MNEKSALPPRPSGRGIPRESMNSIELTSDLHLILPTFSPFAFVLINVLMLACICSLSANLHWAGKINSLMISMYSPVALSGYLTGT